MQCSCNVASDVDECGLTFIEETLRCARKQHRCFECGRTISPKEVYEHARGMWDGSFSTYKTCIDCYSIRRAMFKNGWVYGWMWNDIHSFLEESGLSEDCLITLTATARGKVCELIEKTWEDDNEL